MTLVLTFELNSEDPEVLTVAWQGVPEHQVLQSRQGAWGLLGLTGVEGEVAGGLPTSAQSSSFELPTPCFSLATGRQGAVILSTRCCSLGRGQPGPGAGSE